jgi:hypothetical protein
MNEIARTGLFVAGAAALITAAAWIRPESASSEIYSDAGQAFFPTFRSVDAVKAIEVVDYDEAEAVARPLKVEFRKNRWLLTSHSDYPAEARDRLARTAASLLDLKKDAPVSDRIEDHAKYGVIDPLDARNASLQGRGKRVTLRDAGGAVLAELVLGLPVKEKAGYRYVRLPGQKRVYSVKTDADPSSQFADWVEANLLRASAADITKLTLNSYQIDEQLGRLMNMQRTVHERGQASWNPQAQSIAGTLASLRVMGARPKPKELAEQLRTGQLALTLETVMSLRQRGFFIAPNGMLLSNEGELIAETAKGLQYTVRFGELATDSAAAAAAKPRENRYVFVTASSRNPDSAESAKALTAKFSDWYYIISGADFAKLRPARSAQGKDRPASEQKPPAGLPSGLPPEIQRALEERMRQQKQ